jgi:hypothetical protein
MRWEMRQGATLLISLDLLSGAAAFSAGPGRDR